MQSTRLLTTVHMSHPQNKFLTNSSFSSNLRAEPLIWGTLCNEISPILSTQGSVNSPTEQHNCPFLQVLLACAFHPRIQEVDVRELSVHADWVAERERPYFKEKGTKQR